MRIPTLILTLILALGLGACNGDEKKAPDKTVQGREETKNIRATEAVGYSGDAIANKLDGALNTNDQRKQQLDEAANGAAK